MIDSEPLKVWYELSAKYDSEEDVCLDCPHKALILSSTSKHFAAPVKETFTFSLQSFNSFVIVKMYFCLI